MPHFSAFWIPRSLRSLQQQKPLSLTLYLKLRFIFFPALLAIPPIANCHWPNLIAIRWVALCDLVIYGFLTTTDGNLVREVDVAFLALLPNDSDLTHDFACRLGLLLGSYCRCVIVTGEENLVIWSLGNGKGLRGCVVFYTQRYEVHHSLV